MAFTLPKEVHVPKVPRDLRTIALSNSRPPKKLRVGIESPYPFDVHLSEFSQWSSMGYDVEDLPIDTDREEIVAAVRDAHVTIITSDTGSGKSTRVPQFILDDHQLRWQRCRIAVTQQRRLAAMEISKRVASERGERIIESGHGSAGYAVKDDVVLPYAWK